MEFHTPVMVDEVLEHLRPAPGQTVVDATVGGGGHAAHIARSLAPGGILVAVDLDPDAIDRARARLDGIPIPVLWKQGSFGDLARILTDLGTGLVHGILMDLGVSSHQLDTPGRGFSYWHSAPLDMRLGEEGRTARDLVNALPEPELRRIISEYGEERWASRIASFIVRARARGPIETTDQLVDIIKAAVPASARRSGPHPARRTFQALRIAVNDELGALQRGIKQGVRWLDHGGRLVCLSYHSLEDRLVKRMFAEFEGRCMCPPGLPVCACGYESLGMTVTRRPVTPGEAEVRDNPRARSARLRCFERVLESGGGE